MSEANENGSKWWIRHVIVPIVVALIGGGGIVAIITTITPYIIPVSTPASPVEQSNDGLNNFPLAGNWSGTIKSPDGSFSTELNLFFESSCKTGEVCGTYDAYQLPCSGTLTLIRTEENSFVFVETRTKGEDWCGAYYEHIQKLAGDSVSYGSSDTGFSKDIQSTGILSRP